MKNERRNEMKFFIYIFFKISVQHVSFVTLGNMRQQTEEKNRPIFLFFFFSTVTEGRREYSCATVCPNKSLTYKRNRQSVIYKWNGIFFFVTHRSTVCKVWHKPATLRVHDTRTYRKGKIVNQKLFNSFLFSFSPVHLFISICGNDPLGNRLTFLSGLNSLWVDRI